MRRAFAAVLLPVPLLLVACGGVEDGELTVSGADPSANLSVKCEPEAVVSLGIDYVGEGEALLVGDTSAVELFGGIDTGGEWWDRNYGLGHSDQSGVLDVDVLSTSGSCMVALINADTGETVMRESEGDAEFTMTAHVIRE